ncbi:MAG: redoxin family protein [Planctomycetia bacterium]|nr:redoxin family protein [Planctomycetia bacterium]
MSAVRPRPDSIRSSILGLVAAVIASPAASAAAPTAESALALKPRQKNVDYSTPTAAEAGQATIKQEKEGGVSALVVRGPSGEVLRAFADTDGNRVVDRWSYYKDGLEVYREIDSDKDTKPDEYRWLAGAGSRWGADQNGDGVIDAWKVISAEEATAEVVAAIRDRDAVAFTRLLPTQDDLKAAGFEGEQLAELVARVATAPAAFAAMANKQAEVGADAKWASMLTPQPPGTLPAGMNGLTKDVAAYDNVVALVESKQGNGQVFVGSLVKCGDAWRPVDAPQFAGGSGDLGNAYSFLSPRSAAAAAGPGTGEVAENLKPLLAKLREIEGKMPSADPVARKGLAEQYIGLLEQTVAAAADNDKKFWTNQLVETLAAYVQEGLFPDGIAKLEAVAEAVKGDDAMSAFVAFRLIQAKYSAGMEKPGADGEALQKSWFEDLQSFADTYPKASESAEALLQLAFRDEFEGRDKEAIERYRGIAESFPDTPQSRKAAGAVRRLESVGKPLALAGSTLDGKPASVAAFKGVPVLVHYWSTDCEPCKVDLAQIRELQAKYGDKKVAVVGVALDSDKAKLAKFLQAKPLPWPQLHESGGLDSRLAEEFGVLALPTMVLVGADGNVVDRNVSITDLERKLDELTGDGK